MKTGLSPAAIQYEKAWNDVVSSLPEWKQDIIINKLSVVDGYHVYEHKMDNRIAMEAAKEARILAESRLDN
mgnify:CR=1 FL=1